jgi:Ca2+-binding RTX toxin-like protein
MRLLRLAALVFAVSVVAGLVAVTVSGSHGPQLWAGQWNYSYPGVSGGFAFRHETDTNGAELLEAIGGVACPEPTDYFAGGYTIPDEPPPDVPYIDTGKIRGCTVDNDPRRLQGRYESNQGGGAGSFDITLDETNERWTGTYQPDGDPVAHAWTGFFDNHFADGAEELSDPPYGQTTPDESEPEGPAPPPETPTDLGRCLGTEATITPNPAAPPGFAIQGTTGNDIIVGTNGPDRILALAGNDIVCGFGGNDEIIGADGGDQLYGAGGDDLLDGGSGEDQLYGEAGNDQLLGGTEQSHLEGGPGNDRLLGGETDDDLYGGYSHFVGQPERLVAGADDDDLRGEGGNDLLWGGRGRDQLYGGSGDDRLRAGSGNDALFGEVGTDRLEGDGGNDRMDGGNGGEHEVGDAFGDVTSYFQAPKGVQVNVRPGRVTGGLGADALRGIESVFGSRFDDVLRGTKGRDVLYGDLGDDHISGLSGDDTLIGGGHDDRLIGGTDNDFVSGSSGFDHCSGERRTGCERLIRGAPK